MFQLQDKVNYYNFSILNLLCRNFLFSDVTKINVFVTKVIKKHLYIYEETKYFRDIILSLGKPIYFLIFLDHIKKKSFFSLRNKF